MNLGESIKSWLPLALVLTLMSGLVYATVQQNYRQSANDPQIQLAEDLAASLTAGQVPTTLAFSVKIDMAKSLAPYLIVLDDSGKVITASAILDGEVPVPPKGVLDYTRSHGENRLTWQPQKNVRSAIVVTHYNGPQSGFVIAGRSLREIEKRESQLSTTVFLVWIIALFLTLGVKIMLFTRR